jgi:hypothetical protein
LDSTSLICKNKLLEEAIATGVLCF